MQNNKKVKRILFIPEGDIEDITNYSGIPYFFHKSLEKEIEKYGINLKLIDTKEIINTEDIWRLGKVIIFNNLKKEDIFDKNILGLPGYRLKFRANKILLESFIGKKSYIECLNSVKIYDKSIGAYINKKISNEYKKGDILLSLNPLNPYFGKIDIETFYYLDVSLWKYYFKNPGFLNFTEYKEIRDYYKTIEKDILARASKIFCFSKACADELNEFYSITKNSLKRVYAGFNISESSVKRGSFKNRKITNLLFIGRDFERKGGQYLLEAFRKIREKYPELKLTCITKKEYIQKYQVGEDEMITMLEIQSKEDIQKIFRESDLFIFPTTMDSFGLVVCEAMYYGLPVIGTGFFAIPEIVGKKSKDILTFPHDSNSIIVSIETLINNPEYTEEISKSNYLRARTIFQRNTVIGKILNNIIINTKGLNINEFKIKK